MPKLSKMCYQLLIYLCLQITLLNAAPLLLLPIPWGLQSAQQIVLQKQLLELQALQQLNAQSPFQMNKQPQPLMVLLANERVNPNMDQRTDLRLKHNENVHKSNVNTELENRDDLNSIVIDAAPEVFDTAPEVINTATAIIDNQDQAIVPQHQKAILLLPNGRLSIGEVISAIPWLPIEINVPDTISWAYNGIASGIGSIISIIGRPFQGTAQETPIPGAGMKSLLNQIQRRQQNVVRPIIMMPIDGPVLPIQV